MQIKYLYSLADKGFNIFPLSYGTKIPLKGTKGVSEATTEKDKIKKWIQNNGKLNWGIAGGEVEDQDYYIIFIDVDTKEGKKGEEELKGLIDKYGPIPSTYTVQTASGGFHYYFKTRIKRSRYSARLNGCKNIDIKCSGGYVVLPTSIVFIGKEEKEYKKINGDISNLFYIEDWLGEKTLELITTNQKDYNRAGTIKVHDGRWSFMVSNAGLLRARGLKGESLYLQLLNVAKQLEKKDNDRIDDLWIRNLAESFSNYPDTFFATDQGNADRFIAAYVGEVLHTHSLGWFYWNNKQWVSDEGDKKVLHYAGLLIDVINQEYTATKDKKYKAILKKTVQMLATYKTRNSMLSIAKVSPVISKSPDDFDINKYYFNTDSGIVDLKTGDLIEHDPKQFITKISPIEYNKEKKCPLFMQFLDEITLGRQDLKDFLQVYFGYCLTGKTTEQMFTVFYGTGGNGKSVLVNVISTILGQYALETPVETIMFKNTGSGINNDVARIKGARLVTARESEQGQRLAEGLIKSLTGGDKITARYLRKEFFEFRPEAKWILFTNHKPQIRGCDYGIWRRVKLVPFDYRVPEDKIDKNLEGKLLNESSGIFNWMVEGALIWQDKGFPKSRTIDDATSTYRQDEDKLSEFIEYTCDKEPNIEVKSSAIFSSYRDWCSNNGEKPLSRKVFSNGLEERGFFKNRKGDGIYYLGINIKNQEKEPEF